MAEWSLPISTADILAARPPKNPVDPERPYAYLVEPEMSAAGRVEDVATVFLSNRECPFRCLMCDLWKNTTNTRVPTGAIPSQIDFALSQLPPARHIKLYNSGNFFDAQAIPPDDLQAIARRVRRFETVIVENHPKLCTARCLSFRDALQTPLEIALGLETIHPEVLPRLNKDMTLADFDQAVRFLRDNEINVRAFILLRPPSLTEEQGVEWAVKSIQHAFDVGVQCCSVIPTRVGNGIMEQLQAAGQFTPPHIRSMERVLQEGLQLGRGRVFMDLWDVEQFYDCPRCGEQRAHRIDEMNLTQQIPPPVVCDCEAAS